MAPHTLLISRGTGLQGQPCSRRQVLLLPQVELPVQVLAWICSCPPDAVTATRVGPIWLAHGGLWAEERCEPSLVWPLLGGAVIHGKATGMRPDRHSGGWQGLSEHQAEQASSLLWRYGLPLGSYAIEAVA